MSINWAEQDMRVSRTELKKGYERLQQIAEHLSKLSKKQLKKLPVSEYFLDELIALVEIKTATARNRQIKRIAKLISEENCHDLINTLFAMSFTPEQMIKIDSWYTRLNIHDKASLKLFLKQFKKAEYNSLYQMLLWVEYAKHLQDDELLMESQDDLATYIHEVAILSK
ncbi:MAG: DUF615 domain-containing protein [Moraxellaceae bacterium]|nr:DUF615 domain-containing protein [Moraxellaceae bacterium]